MIYKLELPGKSPFTWMKLFKELVAKAPMDPFQEFATEDKPKGWIDSFTKQVWWR